MIDMQEKEKIVATLAGIAGISYFLDKKYAIGHDLAVYGKLVPTLLKLKRRIARNQTIADLFEEKVDQIPNQTAIMYLNQTLSFIEMEEKANQVANWGLNTMGLRRGDKVALLMENRPEYIWIWMGLLKIDVNVALLNTHIAKKSLLHCISIADTDMLIFGAEYVKQVEEIKDDLPNYRFFVHKSPEYPKCSTPSFAASLNVALESVSTTRPSKSMRDGIQSKDMALMIYTSGTTGLPKAAKINHTRTMYYADVFTASANITPQDRIYCALPLYHTVGGTMGVGMMLVGGATLVLARSFSASKFWKEVRHYDCTVILYIGELCRYLLAVPPDPDMDHLNNVRVAIGNGLRSDIWATFQSRFDIACIVEFYGSTEGNAGLINVCTTPDQQGHLGKTGWFAEQVLGLSLIQYNVETDEHVKDKNGYFVRCQPDEVGELIALNKKNQDFGGYHGNKKATEQKTLTNVFRHGDSYFRTGDLFKQDHNRKWYFMDRIGDTFRWKGENVSTAEVAEIVSMYSNVQEVNIYGVQIPGFDGRACMAAMCWDEMSFNFDDFATYVKAELPSYARPIFIRKIQQMQVTGTLKHQKKQLQSEGMDPSKTSDRMWFLKDGLCYVPLTKEIYPQVLKSRF